MIATAGFRSLAIRPCAPVADGLLGAGRVAVWKPVSALFRLALAAETGVLRGHILTQDLIFVARTGRVSGPASAGPRRCLGRATRRDEGAPGSEEGRQRLSSGPQRAASTAYLQVSAYWPVESTRS